MEFVVSWKYSDDSFEIKANKYFGDSNTFLWPSIGEYVEVENPLGGEDIYGEVIGIIKRYSSGGNCKVEIIIDNRRENDVKETKRI